MKTVLSKTIINNLIFIDTIEGYQLVAKKYDKQKDFLITDNPLLANNPNLEYSIYDVSTLVSQKECKNLGILVLELCNSIEEFTIKNKYKVRYKYYSDKLSLFMVIRPLFLSTLYKSLMIKLFFEKFSVKSFRLVINKSENYNDNDPWNIPRYSNTYKILAELGFFGKLPIFYEYIKVKLPETYNDTSEKNLFVRATVWPYSVIFHHIFSYFNKFISNKKSILVYKECETLRETLPWLQLKGFKIHKIDNLRKIKSKLIKKNMNSEINGKIPDIISQILKSKNFTDDQITSLSKLFIRHISLGLNSLANEAKKINNYFKENIKFRSIILTSGFYGPIANQMFYLSNKYNIKVIGFEHGMTAGINYSNSLYKNYLESTTSNVLMVCSEMAKKVFMEGNMSSKYSQNNEVHVIGEADQKKKIKNYFINRYIIRNRYRIKFNEDLIIHVSGLSYGGNFRNALDGPSDNYLFNREKVLLENVYNKIRKKVIYKEYPSQRLLYQPSFSEIRNLSSNIIMADNSDFRYIRAAADIIVTDSTYSTLSWCMIPKTPVIFLMSSECSKLINKELENLFEKSFFVVNTDLSNWPDKLKSILNLSMSKLKTIWKEKEESRFLLEKNFIFGPKGISGIRAANYIDNLKGHFK